jgi:hypothetical protein
MIPATPGSLDPDWECARDHDPLVQRYRAVFARLDWSVVPERNAARAWPGRPPHPRRAYIKALLVKCGEGMTYVTELRRFLVDHPLLVRELGFHLVRDPRHPFGFDVARTVPTDRWLRHQQQTLDPVVLTALLADTVRSIRAVVPAIGTTIAVDVTHQYAWVAENNPTQAIADAGNPTRQPSGDPDCRLGAKRRANGKGGKVKEYLWGYGWGVAAATDPACGDVVVAERTQPFNHQDITVFHPLYADARSHLGHSPTNVAADAAFDAWHVYQTCAPTGGIAAIPRNDRHPAPERTADGRPICAANRVMTPGREFRHERGFRARDHHCPLLRPTRTGEPCAQPQFATGGCHKIINLEPGGLMRATLDRTSDAYQTIYRQRTCAERIYAQLKAHGLDRPKVRRLAGVCRLNTLTAIIINLGVLARLPVPATNASPPPLC